VSIPFKCLSLQKPQTRRPMGKMLPFFMWFSRDILTKENTFIFNKLSKEIKKKLFLNDLWEKWSYHLLWVNWQGFDQTESSNTVVGY
jgi:hypothetical protein